MLTNLREPPIRVRHADLTRAGDSFYKSLCPKCDEGTLLFRRDQRTLSLLAEDVCIHCGQYFIYEDIDRLRIDEGDTLEHRVAVRLMEEPRKG